MSTRPTIDEVIDFWTEAKKPDDYGVSVPLGELRALQASDAEWKAEVRHLSGLIGLLRAKCSSLTAQQRVERTGFKPYG